MCYGIIAAMSSEAEHLKNNMKLASTVELAGSVLYQGVLCGKDVVVTVSGIGKVNAAVAAQLLISTFKVDYVINTGCAGGLDDRLKVFDVAISDSLCYHDSNLEFLVNYVPYVAHYVADTGLVDKVSEAAKNLGVNYYVGRIVTGDKFIDEKTVKDDIIARLSPLCVEMEGAAIAHVCVRNKVPFVVVRSLSDNADDEAGVSFDTFVQKAADDSAKLVMKTLSLI